MMIRKGFDIEVECARIAAKKGAMDSMARHLSAAQALALYADPTLLPEYGKADAECWQEYEKCKTTTRVAA